MSQTGSAGRARRAPRPAAPADAPSWAPCGIRVCFRGRTGTPCDGPNAEGRPELLTRRHTPTHSNPACTRSAVARGPHANDTRRHGGRRALPTSPSEPGDHTTRCTVTFVHPALHPAARGWGGKVQRGPPRRWAHRSLPSRPSRVVGEEKDTRGGGLTEKRAQGRGCGRRFGPAAGDTLKATTHTRDLSWWEPW